jgi:hypothetical protein
MKLIKSLPIKKTKNGSTAMALFFCEHCKNDVVRPRSRGMEAESCSCVRYKYKKKKLATDKRLCLKCDEEFDSLGIWNRFCETCINENNLIEEKHSRAGVHHYSYAGGHRHKPLGT